MLCPLKEGQENQLMYSLPDSALYWDVEIATFHTCPWTSKWSKCTCPIKILLVPKKRLCTKNSVQILLCW